MPELEQEVAIEGEQRPEVAPASSGDTGRRPQVPAGDMIPRHRLNEALEKARQLESTIKSYQELGRPEDLKEAMSRYKELTKGTRFTPSEKDQLRAEMLELMPELRYIQQDRTNRQETFISRAESEVNSLLKEVGLEVNDDNNKDLQELIAGRIARDPKLVQRYQAGDLGAVKEAWMDIKRRFSFGNTKRTTEANVQRLKGATRAPSTPQSSAVPKKPLEELTEREVLSNAHDTAFDRIEAQLEE